MGLSYKTSHLLQLTTRINNPKNIYHITELKILFCE